ncbi:hypothetical protein BDV40DRAFT_288422 [Aspergillus tamarii]|uniref:Alcohol acetyltransferase n=1 Tax=Aspergillus tamarii TaxID=41984 RepID=A0A5N6UXD5_ASPTM|nr:hypothetical protein BDV40DRAFT_288422 [Aspergillus tamarii]
MEQQPHCLDLGAQRMFQGSLLLVFRGQLDVASLYECHRQLLAAWPLLAMRMNLTRSRFIPSRDPLGNSWSAKVIPKTLDSCLPSLSEHTGGGQANLSETDRVNLRSLLRFPYKLSKLLYPPVLSAKVVQFYDGCIFESIIQHPLCDASGHLQILEAYATLLKGQTISPIFHQRPSVPQLWKDSSHAAQLPNTIVAKQMLDRFRALFGTGWIGFLLMAISVWFIRLTRSEPHVEKTVRIPASVLDRLSARAEVKGIQVTRGDLLMAIVLRALTISFPTDRSATFGFTMSIARELQLSGDLHNPFWPVFVPHSMVLNRPDIQKEQHLIEQAANLREVIRAARSIEFQHAYMEEHKKMAKRPLLNDLSPS